MNPKFSVGITVLRQYEQLHECLGAIGESEIVPEKVFVVDNGRSLSSLGAHPNVFVISPPRNLGVAASWNLLLQMIHPSTAIILNDDCVIKPDTFSRLLEPAVPALVKGFGNACFRHDAGIVDLVGLYDEQFWPAYYEDADYEVRMRKIGLRSVDLGNIVMRHGNHGERPYQNFGPTELAEFHKQLEANKQRFIAKWGGLPSEVGV